MFISVEGAQTLSRNSSAMEGEPVKDLFRYTCVNGVWGHVCRDYWSSSMQEWCVANWDTLQQVLC